MLNTVSAHAIKSRSAKDIIIYFATQCIDKKKTLRMIQLTFNKISIQLYSQSVSSACFTILHCLNLVEEESGPYEE